MSETNFYELLGVAPDVDAREIKRAFRRLARVHHPDLNPDDAEAAERFIEIAAAFEVLSDPHKRALYDEFGLEGLQEHFDIHAARRKRQQERTPPEPTYSFDPKKSSIFSDVFGDVFRNSSFMRSAFDDLRRNSAADEDSGFFRSRQDADRAGRAPMRGADRHDTLRISMAKAVRGGVASFEHRGETLVVRVPAGVQDGEELLVTGEGEPSLDPDGPPGDLRLAVNVQGHERLTRDGLDLTLVLPITFAEALLGARVTVPTPHGDYIVTLPEGISSGMRLRLREMGVHRDGERGDFYVIAEIHSPTRITEAMRAAVKTLDEGYTSELRARLFDE